VRDRLFQDSLFDVATLVSGAFHTCATTDNAFGKAIYCWGDNGYKRTSPTVNETEIEDAVKLYDFPADDSLIAMGLGVDHSCFAWGSGLVKCIGNNANGQLGNSDGASPITPPPTGIVALTAGYRFNCAISDEGIECWGSNVRGQLGQSPLVTENMNPAVVPGLSDIKAIDAGYYHTCVLAGDNTVKCWGDNSSAQLGTRDTSLRGPITVAF
jgi:alpha-tubulin suppressor-like RCC1 family protein